MKTAHTQQRGHNPDFLEIGSYPWAFTPFGTVKVIGFEYRAYLLVRRQVCFHIGDALSGFRVAPVGQEVCQG